MMNWLEITSFSSETKTLENNVVSRTRCLHIKITAFLSKQSKLFHLKLFRFIGELALNLKLKIVSNEKLCCFFFSLVNKFFFFNHTVSTALILGNLAIVGAWEFDLYSIVSSAFARFPIFVWNKSWESFHIYLYKKIRTVREKTNENQFFYDCFHRISFHLSHPMRKESFELLSSTSALR